MSIYDTIQKISKITNVKHSISPDKVIARFYINDSTINYYFSEYNRAIFLNHLGFNYDRIEVNYQFWDPKFCKAEMLMTEDIHYFETLDVFRDNVTWNAAAGFVLSLIGIYNIVMQSYNSANFDQIAESIDFDKQILGKVFKHVDIVVSMPETLLNFIRNIYTESILDILVTPSGDFRFTIEDIELITMDTLLVHEISSLIDKHVIDELSKLRYYTKLLENCGEFQPPFQICNFSDDNIMLNICKLNVNIETCYPMIESLISLYYDRGGTFIQINLDPKQRYPNFNIIYRTFKNLYSISSEDMF